MFVYVDESGDADLPGIKPYFALSAAAFDTDEHQKGMEDALTKLREGWGKALPNGEFKFWKLKHDDRIRFFTAVGDLPFRHASCVLLKPGLKGQWAEKRYRFERVIEVVVGGLTPYFREVDAGQEKPLKVRVTADEYDDPIYWEVLKAKFFALRSKDGSGMVKSVRPGRSRSSLLLQLADLLCGANRWDTDDYRHYVAVQHLARHTLP